MPDRLDVSLMSYSFIVVWSFGNYRDFFKVFNRRRRRYSPFQGLARPRDLTEL